MRAKLLRSLLALLLGAAFCVACSPSIRAAEEAAADETSGEESTADKGHTGAGHADEGHNGEHAEGGVPMNFQQDLALWSLVAFLIFLWLLKKLAWTPLIEGLDNRENRVREDIAKAEEARTKAQEMLQEHEKKLDAVQDEVREILAEARRDADHTRQEIVSAAQKEAETTRQRAVEDINRAKEQALSELFEAVNNQVAFATEHVLGRSMTDDDQQRLIDEALEQFHQEPASGQARR